MQDFYAQSQHNEFNSKFSGQLAAIQTPVDIDDFQFQKLEYRERTAYALEHTMKVNVLLQINPSYVNFKQIKHQNDIGRLTAGVMPKFCFATGDQLGTIRVWNLDMRESLFCLRKSDCDQAFPI